MSALFPIQDIKIFEIEASYIRFYLGVEEKDSEIGNKIPISMLERHFFTTSGSVSQLCTYSYNRDGLNLCTHLGSDFERLQLLDEAFSMLLP